MFKNNCEKQIAIKRKTNREWEDSQAEFQWYQLKVAKYISGNKHLHLPVETYIVLVLVVLLLTLLPLVPVGRHASVRRRKVVNLKITQCK